MLTLLTDRRRTLLMRRKRPRRYAADALPSYLVPAGSSAAPHARFQVETCLLQARSKDSDCRKAENV